MNCVIHLDAQYDLKDVAYPAQTVPLSAQTPVNESEYALQFFAQVKPEVHQFLLDQALHCFALQ